MVPYRGMEVPYRECGPTGRVQGEAAHAPGIELFSGSCDLGLVTSLDHDEVGLYGHWILSQLGHFGCMGCGI